MFNNPRTLIILLIIVVLLFGASKLPGLARNLGRSARILKAEAEGLSEDGKKSDAAPDTTVAESSSIEGSASNDSPRNSIDDDTRDSQPKQQ